MRHRAFGLFAVALSLAMLASAGCADAGTAPAISSLSIMPGAIPVGTTSTLTGSLTFEDHDGDVMDLNIVVRLPDGTSMSLAPTPVVGASGVVLGSVSFAVLLAPPSAGRYVLTTFVRDANGNESNRLETPIDAS